MKTEVEPPERTEHHALSGKVQVDLLIESIEWNSYGSSLVDDIQNISTSTLEQIGYFNHYNKAEMSLLLADDAKLKHLNKEYLGKDKATNVLSFPYHDIIKLGNPIENYFLGDIAISYEKVMAEALEQGKTFKEHFSHLLVHGILHLVGFDHEKDSEAEIMEAHEVKILSTMGVKNPYIEL